MVLFAKRIFMKCRICRELIQLYFNPHRKTTSESTSIIPQHVFQMAQHAASGVPSCTSLSTSFMIILGWFILQPSSLHWWITVPTIRMCMSDLQFINWGNKLTVQKTWCYINVLWYYFHVFHRWKTTMNMLLSLACEEVGLTIALIIS